MAFDKVIDSAQLDGALEATANKIREKTGETGSIPWDADNGFASAIESLEVGGGEEYDEYNGNYTVTPTKSKITLETQNKVMNANVTVEAIPSTYIQPSGTVQIKENKTTYDVRNYASAYVDVAAGGNIDALLTGSIKEFESDSMTTIRDYAFASATLLESVDLPNVTSMGRSVFLGCSSLANVNLPLLTELGQQAFQNSGIQTITLPNVTKINGSAFMACASLESLTLPGSTVCELAATNVFSNSGIKYIYVPSNLVSTYKSATNWSSHASKIKAIT